MGLNLRQFAILPTEKWSPKLFLSLRGYNRKSFTADLIAGGLSFLKPELAAVAAARLLLREIDRFTGERKGFALEAMCSGLTHSARI